MEQFRRLVTDVLAHRIKSMHTYVDIHMYAYKATMSVAAMNNTTVAFTDLIADILSQVTLQDGCLLSEYSAVFKRFEMSIAYLSLAMRPIDEKLHNKIREIENNRTRTTKPNEPPTPIVIPQRQSIARFAYQAFYDIIIKRYNVSLQRAALELLTEFRKGNVSSITDIKSLVESYVKCCDVISIDTYTEFKNAVFEDTTSVYSEKVISLDDIRGYICQADAWINSESRICDTIIVTQLLKEQYRELVCELIINAKLKDILDLNILTLSNEQLRCVYNLMKYASHRDPLYTAFYNGVLTSIQVAIEEECIQNPDYRKTSNVISIFIDMYANYTVIIDESFDRDASMYTGLSKAMTTTVNRNRLNTETSPNTVAILLTKYVNNALVNRSFSDDERSGMLLLAAKVYGFLEGKDIFHVYFKRDYKVRMLEKTSISDDTEQMFMSYIKSVYAYPGFLKDMSVMRADYMSSIEIARKYATTDAVKSSNVNMSPLIVTPSVWPFARAHTVTCDLPADVQAYHNKFEDHYKSMYNNTRGILWLHEHSKVTIKAPFSGKRYEITMTMFQYTVFISVYNYVKPPVKMMPVHKLQDITGIPTEHLYAVITSLCTLKLIQRNPGKGDTTPQTNVRVNPEFTSTRLKLNASVAYRPPVLTNVDDETQQQIIRDRENNIQAAIVRVMKARKTDTLANIVSEVLRQTCRYFPSDANVIRRQIEVLTNLDEPLLEKCDNDTYKYMN